jgi:hypothetical protein
MSLDLPFGSEDLMQIGRYDEPDCLGCSDEGHIEWGSRIVPCPDCRPAEFDYTIDVGEVEP